MKFRSTVVVAVSLGALACGSVTFPDSPPLIEDGIIVALLHRADNDPEKVTGIWAKEDPEDECGYRFSFFDDTEIGERMTDGSLRSRSAGFLAVGQRVRVWGGPNIADSCPGQTTGVAVEVLPS